MTRKKLVKILMGRYGMERNNANAAADTIRKYGDSYITGLRKYDLHVRAWAKEWGLPVAMLLVREKGANKAYRRYLKNQKRAVHMIVHTHQNQPGPNTRVTVRVGRSNNQQEAGGAAV